MQLSWRRRAPREADPELLWLGVSIGTVAAAAIWFALGLPWPHCTFLALTGHPCATCGATRCAIQFFHGNFLTALKWNPLIFAGLCGIALFDVYAAVVLVTRAPRFRISQLSLFEKNIVRAIVVGALALNWAYLWSHWPPIADHLSSTMGRPTSSTGAPRCCLINADGSSQPRVSSR